MLFRSGNTTDIATLTANPSDGETITLTGGAATFAAGATLTLATSGTVAFAEKVTTKGALTLARGDDVYRVWTGAVLTTGHPSTPAFPDIVTNDQVSATDVANTWECIHVVGGTPASDSTAGITSAGRFTRVTGGIGNGSFVICRHGDVFSPMSGYSNDNVTFSDYYIYDGKLTVNSITVAAEDAITTAEMKFTADV